MRDRQHKNCIISYANERGNYKKALQRLKQSLAGKYSGDFMGFGEEEGWPLHLDNPYAFKIYAFAEAFNRGYDNVLWLDSSVYAIDYIDHLFDIIENEGYLMQEAGAYVGEWTNDRTLDYFNITRDEAMTMPMYGNAGMLGISQKCNDNWRSYAYVAFFQQWLDSMLAGCFKGEWTNENKTESQDERCKGHRHDMSCGSIIANLNLMKFKSGNEILQYAAPTDKPNNKTICLFAQGM